MPAAQRRQFGIWLQCTVCNRTYSKREHLQRHERSHTGEKPFACPTCGRRFARQDALDRHARLHQRNGSDGTASTQQDSNMFIAQELDTSQYQVHPENMLISPITSNDSFSQPAMPNSTLFWPDSESLLQNIMSIDPALWEQPGTMMPSVLTGQHSPELLFDSNATSTAGDEGHRAIQTLSAQLSNTLTGVTAPATLADLTSKFLDSCLHNFFSIFVPMLPVVHRPTFVFRECSPPLLLNAMAIGSLFLGTKEASAKGDALWRLAHTAVATAWHSMITHRGEYDTASGLQLVQTSLLSQVYAALAKSRTLRMTSQVFHGLGFYWARHCGLFDLPEIPKPPLLDAPADVVHQAWRVWLAQENRLRTLLGLYILDGVISQYSGNPTFAQHMSNPLSMPCDEHIYNASDAQEWLHVISQRDRSMSKVRFCDVFRVFFYSESPLNKDIPPDISFLALKVVLEGLESLVAESNRVEPRPVGVPSSTEINLVLDRVRQYIQNNPKLSIAEKRSAMLRWHAICLDTWRVAARGARRLCRSLGIPQSIFGGRDRFEDAVDPEGHVSKDEARRTLLHAKEIHRIASQLPLGLAHDPHIPGAVFAAATTYAAFALAGRMQMPFPALVDWRVTVLLPSLDTRSPDPHDNLYHFSDTDNPTAAFIRGTFEASEVTPNSMIIDLSYEMSSIRLILRALSLQWGVCTEMEEVLDAWIAKCA